MRIAVNTRLLLPGKLEGIGWFAFETLSRITRDHPEVEFIFIFDRKPSPEFLFGKNVRAVVAYPQARHPILWYLFFEFGVRRVLRKYKPDLFVSPDGWLTLGTDTPSLAVIHDLNFEAHPEFLPRHIAWYYHYFFPRFAAKARRIATVSEYTKADITKRYGKPTDAIDVVYNGASTDFVTLDAVEISEVRARYSHGKPYFLFVGLIHPRKNLENQLRAFDAFKTQTGSDAKFIVAGARHWWDKGLADVVEKSEHKADIIFLGRQDKAQLVRLCGAAFALMYVSHFEGFGIPILEAMSCDVPVITSDCTSMPEVCGEAGLLVPPHRVDLIVGAMVSLYENDVLRQQLIEAGRIQRRKFSWNLTAAALWQSMVRCVDGDQEHASHGRQ